MQDPIQLQRYRHTTTQRVGMLEISLKRTWVQSPPHNQPPFSMRQRFNSKLIRRAICSSSIKMFWFVILQILLSQTVNSISFIAKDWSNVTTNVPFSVEWAGATAQDHMYITVHREIVQGNIETIVKLVKVGKRA